MLRRSFLRSYCNTIKNDRKELSFCHNSLDRVNNFRDSLQFIQECKEKPQAKVVLFHDLNPLVSIGSQASIQWRSLSSLKAMIKDLPIEPVLLGLDEDKTPCFAMDISKV